MTDGGGRMPVMGYAKGSALAHRFIGVKHVLQFWLGFVLTRPCWRHGLIRQLTVALRHLGVVLMALGGGLSLAGPPFQTDDPEPVELHHLEFYIASQQTRTSSGRSGTLPHLEFNYGAAPDLQLHLMTPLAFSQPAAGGLQRGYGDTELGIKYRLVHEDADTPMVGIFPTYVAPTGHSDRGLGNGAPQVYLPVWLQKSWGKCTSYGGVGYWINHASGGRNNWFSGWLIQRELSDRWTLGAEVFHRTAQGDGQASSTGTNVGGIYRLDDTQDLLFSFGKGLRNVSKTNRFSTYIGYQAVY